MKLERTTALAAAGVSMVVVSTVHSTDGWQQPNRSVDGARATRATTITSRTVVGLRPLWRFRLSLGSPYGSFASTPVISDGMVYAQDLSSSVYALDAATGKRRWTYHPAGAERRPERSRGDA